MKRKKEKAEETLRVRVRTRESKKHKEIDTQSQRLLISNTSKGIRQLSLQVTLPLLLVQFVCNMISSRAIKIKSCKRRSQMERDHFG